MSGAILALVLLGATFTGMAAGIAVGWGMRREHDAADHRLHGHLECWWRP